MFTQDYYDNLLKAKDYERFLQDQKRSIELELRKVKSDIQGLQDTIVKHYHDNGLVSDVVKFGDIELEFKLTKPRGVMVIEDPEAIPQEFVKYEPKVDKKSFSEYLKGKNINEYGVHYEYGEPNITWRAVK